MWENSRRNNKKCFVNVSPVPIAQVIRSAGRDVRKGENENSYRSHNHIAYRSLGVFFKPMATSLLMDWLYSKFDFDNIFIKIILVIILIGGMKLISVIFWGAWKGREK